MACRRHNEHRPWHILSPVKGEHVPERIVSVAVEPLVGRPLPCLQEHTFGTGYARCAWLKHGEVVDAHGFQFDRAEYFWNFLDGIRSRRGSTWVFGHNMGYVLTLLGFWELLDRGGDKLVAAVLSDPPVIVTTRRKGRLIKYVDTQNYSRSDISELGSGIGCDVARHPEPATGRDERTQSCRDRCFAQLAWISGIIQSLRRSRAGAFAATAAGIAWNVYRHSFLSVPIWVHGNESVLKLERRSYRGGRCEARTYGHVSDPVAVYDCNSMYPSVMASEPHPHKLIAYFREGSHRVLYQALRRFWCVADVELVGGHPPLPMRVNGMVRYHGGAGQCTLAGAELVAARDAAAIVRVHELAVYETADLFSTYVTYLYPRKVAARAAGNLAEADFYKLCLNSLYGKFAQKGRRWHDCQTCDAWDRYAEWWAPCAGSDRLLRHRSIAGRCQHLREGPEPRHSFPAISAGITACGRTRLERAIELAGRSSCHYVDTDSVHVACEGQSRMLAAGVIDSSALGRWKAVCQGPDAHYWSEKHYRVGDWWVCNFLAASAKNVAHGTFLQHSFQRLEQTLATGVVDRVLVQERTIRLPAGNWDRSLERRHNGEPNHGCPETHKATQAVSTSMPLLS